MRALVLTFALAACAAQQPPTGGPALAGTSWVRIDRGEDAPHFPTLDFETERAAGHAGCNRWFATVSQNGEQLTFSAVGATRMMCAAPAMATERALFAALGATRGARIENDQLVLSDSNSRDLARFDRAN